MDSQKLVTTIVVIGVILVLSLALNVYQAFQLTGVSSSNVTLSRGVVGYGGLLFDETGLRLGSLANLTTVIIRNVTFTYISNTSNGTRWAEFLVSGMAMGSAGGPRWNETLRAYYWCVALCTESQREAFTLGTSPIAGVVTKVGDPGDVYLLVGLPGEQDWAGAS
jgi:hypothetical protein